MGDTCPLCFGASLKRLYVINGFRILQCRNCTLVFSSPMPSEKELERYYKKYGYKEGYFHEGEIRTDAKRILKTLSSLGIHGGSLLDVGCGLGFFMDEARKKDFIPLGIDLAEDPANYAIKKLGLRVIRQNIMSFTSSSRFQVISLIQVIEHLRDPDRVLKHVISLLDEKGILCIATPNITSIMSKVLKEKFNYLIPPEHTLYFSPFTLRRFLEKFGLDVITMKTFGYPEDVGSIYRHWMKNNKIPALNGKKNNDTSQNKRSQIIEKESFRHRLFERHVRKFCHPLLNLGMNGSMIEAYARKKT